MITAAQIPSPMISPARVPSALIAASRVPASLFGPAVVTPFVNVVLAPGPYTWLFGDGTPMLFGDGSEMAYV